MKTKTKIAFLSSYLPKKGPVKVLLETIKNIDFNKYEIYLYTFKDEIDDSYKDELLKYPIHFKQIKGGNIFKNLFKNTKLLQNELDSNQVKIVHSHCLPSLFISVFLKNKIRLNTIHFYPGILLNKKKGNVIGSIVNVINKLALKKIEKPICCSESISKEFLKNDNLKFDYVQNGVSPINFPISDRNEICTILNLDPKYKYFISLGRFSNEKNFEYLISEFKKLDLRDYKLIILGTGPLYDKLKLLENDKVLLPGFKTNIYDYLFISDFYVSTSITEGLPMSVLEAISMSKPVLLSNIDSHLEIIEGNNIGKSFILNNSNDFKDKVYELLELDYNLLSKNSLEVFTSKFSSRIMTENYQKIYDSIL